MLTLPPTDAPPEPTPFFRRVWFWVACVLGFVVLATGIAVNVVRVPYYAFSPGTVRTTVPMVQVDGAPIYTPEGDVMVTTVSISQQRLTIFRAIQGWLDPAVTVVDEEVVIGGAHDREEARQINLQLMSSSQDVATYVALTRLGHDVELAGTGSFIASVSEGTPAEGVLEPGDTVVAVDGEPIELGADLVAAIDARAPGTEVTLSVQAFGSEETEQRTVVLGQREEDPDAAFLGVVPQTRDGRFLFPFEVQFQTGQVGGPSAGLTFTLTLLDLLTPGELTGGLQIAATGTIDVNGNLGAVGGVEQKAAAVRREGVDVFLVPASIPDHELDAARRQAGDAVRIIEVETLDDALEALESLGGDPLPVMAAAA